MGCGALFMDVHEQLFTCPYPRVCCPRPFGKTFLKKKKIVLNCVSILDILHIHNPRHNLSGDFGKTKYSSSSDIVRLLKFLQDRELFFISAIYKFSKCTKLPFRFEIFA